MSSLPGYTLEDFLMWNYDLIVDDDGGANPSLQIAEACGVQTRRKRITGAQFAPLVAMFEPYRDKVEWRLGDFDEENMSWRDYAGYSFDFIPDELYERGSAVVRPPDPTSAGITDRL